MLVGKQAIEHRLDLIRIPIIPINQRLAVAGVAPVQADNHNVHHCHAGAAPRAQLRRGYPLLEQRIALGRCQEIVQPAQLDRCVAHARRLGISGCSKRHPQFLEQRPVLPAIKAQELELQTRQTGMRLAQPGCRGLQWCRREGLPPVLDGRRCLKRAGQLVDDCIEPALLLGIKQLLLGPAEVRHVLDRGDEVIDLGRGQVAPALLLRGLCQQQHFRRQLGLPAICNHLLGVVSCRQAPALDTRRLLRRAQLVPFEQRVDPVEVILRDLPAPRLAVEVLVQVEPVLLDLLRPLLAFAVHLPGDQLRLLRLERASEVAALHSLK